MVFGTLQWYSVRGNRHKGKTLLSLSYNQARRKCFLLASLLTLNFKFFLLNSQPQGKGRDQNIRARKCFLFLRRLRSNPISKVLYEEILAGKSLLSFHDRRKFIFHHTFWQRLWISMDLAKTSLLCTTEKWQSFTSTHQMGKRWATHGISDAHTWNQQRRYFLFLFLGAIHKGYFRQKSGFSDPFPVCSV